MSQTSHESVMRTPYSLSPILIVLLISICAPVDAQVPTAQSGNFRTHPLVPAHGDTVGLTLGGSFAYSNALMTATDVSVVPELVTVNLTATWDEGTSAPVDGVTTSWSVDVDLGPLDEQVFDLLVRVDGEQFFFTYFVVEAARATPAPLPMPVTTITPQRPLGINLTAMKDHARALIFADIFKPSREWIPHRLSDDTWDTGMALDLDERGWVRSLAADQEAGTLMMSGLGDAYPGGRYRVLYEGTGVLDFDWDARIIDSQPGRMDLWVTPDQGIHVVIKETDPEDYIRNIRVIMPGHEETFTSAPFHPTYIQFLRQFSLLRFMDWSDTNEPENVTPEAGLWENRVTPDHASQGTIRGVAYEHMIDLANEVGSDLWISVPITATDDFIDSLATLVRDRLDQQRLAYIELSNEIWNRDFPQHAVATAAGRARGYADTEAATSFQFLTDSEGFVAALRYQSARSIEVFQIFESVMGARDRFRGVICGWAIDDLTIATNIAEELLDWQNAHASVDAYAIAPYFGFFIAQEDFADRVVSRSVEALLDTITQDMRFMLDVGRTAQDVAAARGLDLMTYEAGHHMVRATEVPYPSDDVRAKADLVHADERMYDIYAEYLAGWFEFGDHMTLFSDFLALGNFGLASRWDQSPIYPKYRAVHDFLLTTAPGDSTFVPPGTEPEPEPVSIPGDGDGDGDVDVDDFFAFADAFGSQGGVFDLDGDGTVDVDDFFAFANVFGTGVQ